MTSPPRATKPDILELYGLAAMDPLVSSRVVDRECPFTKSRCVQLLQGSLNPTGVCVVSSGSTKSPIVICDNRFYGDDHATLRLAANDVFGTVPFILGGTYDDLKARLTKGSVVVAFGENSGGRVQVSGKGKVSFDWVLQQYTGSRRGKFMAIEVETLQTTGSYRSALDGYRLHHSGKKAIIPPSAHGIDWAVIAKTILPDLIRKGLIVGGNPNCFGYQIVLPDAMLARIDEMFEDVPDMGRHGQNVMSFRAYAADRSTSSGVRLTRSMNLLTRDVAAAFYGQVDSTAATKLDNVLKGLL